MLKRILPAILLTLAVSLTLLAASVYVPGTNDELMLRLMRHYAPAAATGLPDAEYPAMAEMITAYLRGDADEFQHRYTVNGAECLAFHEKEQHHMADVQGLFTLCRHVAWFAWLPVLLLACRKGYASALRTGLLTVLGAVACIALWAAIDFDSLFILFHRIAFTNDLWLLDPRTDLLIRLMPTPFFVAYAAIIGALWAAGMGLFILIFTLLTKRKKA